MRDEREKREREIRGGLWWHQREDLEKGIDMVKTIIGIGGMLRMYLPT